MTHFYLKGLPSKDSIIYFAREFEISHLFFSKNREEEEDFVIEKTARPKKQTRHKKTNGLESSFFEETVPKNHIDKIKFSGRRSRQRKRRAKTTSSRTSFLAEPSPHPLPSEVHPTNKQKKEKESKHENGFVSLSSHSPNSLNINSFSSTSSNILEDKVKLKLLFMDVFKKLPIPTVVSLLEQNKDKPEVIADQLTLLYHTTSNLDQTSGLIRDILLRNKEVHSQFKDRRLFWRQWYEFLMVNVKESLQVYPFIGCSPLNLYTLYVEVTKKISSFLF